MIETVYNEVSEEPILYVSMQWAVVATDWQEFMQLV